MDTRYLVIKVSKGITLLNPTTQTLQEIIIMLLKKNLLHEAKVVADLNDSSIANLSALCIGKISPKEQCTRCQHSFPPDCHGIYLITSTWKGSDDQS